MKRLIINADGFGFTPGMNKGIYEAIAYGVVTSTSCVVNFPYIEEVSNLASDFPKISIGIHFNLSVGKPVTHPESVPTLVNERGEFWGVALGRRILSGKIKYKEMKRELENQIKILLERGIQPTHWDGHQDKHLYPAFFFAAMSVAKKHGILRMRTHRRYFFVPSPARRKSFIIKHFFLRPHRLLTHLSMRLFMKVAKVSGFRMADRLLTPIIMEDSGKYLLETWLSLVRNLPEGTSEIICHPGYVDDVLRKYAKYVQQREQELRVLTSERLKREIENQRVELISFREL